MIGLHLVFLQYFTLSFKDDRMRLRRISHSVSHTTVRLHSGIILFCQYDVSPFLL
jgi:hypothetical protein